MGFMGIDVVVCIATDGMCRIGRRIDLLYQHLYRSRFRRHSGDIVCMYFCVGGTGAIVLWSRGLHKIQIQDKQTGI